MPASHRPLDGQQAAGHSPLLSFSSNKQYVCATPCDSSNCLAVRRDAAWALAMDHGDGSDAEEDATPSPSPSPSQTASPSPSQRTANPPPVVAAAGAAFASNPGTSVPRTPSQPGPEAEQTYIPALHGREGLSRPTPIPAPLTHSTVQQLRAAAMRALERAHPSFPAGLEQWGIELPSNKTTQRMDSSARDAQTDATQLPACTLPQSPSLENVSAGDGAQTGSEDTRKRVTRAQSRQAPVGATATSSDQSSADPAAASPAVLPPTGVSPANVGDQAGAAPSLPSFAPAGPFVAIGNRDGSAFLEVTRGDDPHLGVLAFRQWQVSLAQHAKGVCHCITSSFPFVITRTDPFGQVHRRLSSILPSTLS